MADSDTNHFLNMLRGSEAFETDPLPAQVGSTSNGDAVTDVIVKVDSDMLCLAGYYALSSVAIHYRDNAQRPSTSLSSLLTRILGLISGPSSNDLNPRDLLVKTSSSLSSSTLPRSAATDSLVPPSVHSGNPADYVVQGYMDQIVSGAAGSSFVSLRRASADEAERADSASTQWFIALWLHVNSEQARRSNRPGFESDLPVDTIRSTTHPALKDLGSFSVAAAPFTTPSSPNAAAPARPLPSFTPLPAGTVAAAARAASLQHSTTGPDSGKSANGRVPGMGDEVEIGRAFGARFGFGSLWGKVGLGKRPAAEVLATIAPAIQVMREMNKKNFEYQGKIHKLTKKIMIQGLGIADKSFSPMETAFRRGQYLLNVVAEHSLVDDTGNIDLVGEVFTDRHSSLTVDELYTANERAHEAVRKAALAKGLTELADMMHTDWSMGRHTWKIRASEPRPSYVGDVAVTESQLREDPASAAAEAAAHAMVASNAAANGAGAGEGDGEPGDEEDDANELLDLEQAGQEEGDLPVDPELMGMGQTTIPTQTTKRRGSTLAGNPPKRRLA